MGAISAMITGITASTQPIPRILVAWWIPPSGFHSRRGESGQCDAYDVSLPPSRVIYFAETAIVEYAAVK